MRPCAIVVACLLSLGACKPTEESHMKAIIGALLIDGSGGPPLSDSVVVIAGDHIREAGPRSNVVIPAEADKVDGSGKCLVPALMDVYAHGTEAANTIGAPVIHIWKTAPPVAQAALESARDAHIPAIGHISTEAEARFLTDNGVSGFIGMIVDTEDLDPALLARWRDLHIFFAPALASAGARLEIAKRNAHRLFAGGVPIAAASNGGDLYRETELLVEAGIPPLDVIVAATRNAATALGQLDRIGTIQAGKRANLLLLSANPGEDIHNLRKVVLRMSGGEWIR